jgi:hypothetical protein
VTVPRTNPLDALLNFPSVGPTETWIYRNRAPLPGMPDNNYHGMLNLTSGAGVVREIKLQTGLVGTGAFNGWWKDKFIQIYPDCGNSAGGRLPSTNYLTFNAPISVLLSDRYSTTNGNGTNISSKNYDTRYVACAQSFTNYVYLTVPGVIFEVILKLTCPFTNGIYITLNDSVWGEGAQYTTVNYSLDPSGQLDYPFSNWRLRSHFTRGTFSQPNPGFYGAPTDWDHVVPVLLDAHGPGVMLGLWASFDLTAQPEAMEGSFQVYGDGGLRPWQGDGEDTFDDPWEFKNGSFIGYDVGVPNFVRGQCAEFYRQWGSSGAVYWNVGAYGVFTCIPTFCGTGRADRDILTVYYGP